MNGWDRWQSRKGGKLEWERWMAIQKASDKEEKFNLTCIK
jgi:hypothetical protein